MLNGDGDDKVRMEINRRMISSMRYRCTSIISAIAARPAAGLEASALGKVKVLVTLIPAYLTSLLGQYS